MVRRSFTLMALVIAGIALVACGSDDHSKVENAVMTAPNYQPAIITAFADKAYLVRQVAADQGVQYDEVPVPGKDQITFSFKKLDTKGVDKLVLAMPREVFAKRAIITGGSPPPGFKEVR